MYSNRSTYLRLPPATGPATGQRRDARSAGAVIRKTGAGGARSRGGHPPSPRQRHGPPPWPEPRRFYRSADPTITTTDTGVGMAMVPGLASAGSSSRSATRSEFHGEVEVVAPSPAGTYFYGACVDPVTDESGQDEQLLGVSKGGRGGGGAA